MKIPLKLRNPSGIILTISIITFAGWSMVFAGWSIYESIFDDQGPQYGETRKAEKVIQDDGTVTQVISLSDRSQEYMPEVETNENK